MGDPHPKVGFGADVHRLRPGPGPLRLCGIDFDVSYSLEGTSDADVGLHAVIDSILGAAGLGDIGELFPPSDPAWAGADSAELARIAADRLRRDGYRIGNIDITVIAQTVRIADRRSDMCRAVASSLSVPVDAVSVKGTTTDGLGLIGRSEGIAALAVAAVFAEGPQQ